MEKRFELVQEFEEYSDFEPLNDDEAFSRITLVGRPPYRSYAVTPDGSEKELNLVDALQMVS